MSGKSFNKEEILAKYEEKRDKYDRLGILLNRELKTLFETNEIPIMDIYYRTRILILSGRKLKENRIKIHLKILKIYVESE